MESQDQPNDKKIVEDCEDKDDCFGSFKATKQKCDTCEYRVECEKAVQGVAKYTNISIKKSLPTVADEDGRSQKGKDNGRFLHGGNVMQLLDSEEVEQFKHDIKSYVYAYPYIGEDPVMMDLLLEYEMMKIQLSRIRLYVMDDSVPMKEKFGAEKLADQYRRTMSLYATRMGITYVSRQRKQDQIVKRSPFEVWASENDVEKDE